MQFNDGELIDLNGYKYEVIRTLGGGALARVYLLEPLFLPGHEVILKVPQREFDPESPADMRMLEGLKREIEVLGVLNRAEDPQWDGLTEPSARLLRAQATKVERRIIAMLDAGQFGPTQPFNLQEKAPDGFTRFPVSPYDASEKHVFLLMRELLLALALVHEKGYALRDFDPETKIDRLRVEWLSKDKFELKIIDWNVTGNQEDQPRDLLFWGGYLLYALTGLPVAFEGPDHDQISPYFNFDALSQKLSSGAKMILKRALHREPAKRYARSAQILADIDWWVSILELCEAPDGSDKLQTDAQDSFQRREFERVLAMGELALRQTITIKNHEIFKSLRQKAYDELSRQDQLPLLEAKGYLNSGYFSKAIGLFSELRKSYPAGHDETVRATELYRCQAHDGEQRKSSASAGQNPLEYVSKNNDWQILQQARLYLEQNDVISALNLLVSPDFDETYLKYWAQGYTSATEAWNLANGAGKEYPVPSSYEVWRVQSREQCDDLNKAIKYYEAAIEYYQKAEAQADEPRLRKEIDRIKTHLKIIEKITQTLDALNAKFVAATQVFEHVKLEFPDNQIRSTQDPNWSKQAADQFILAKAQIEPVVEQSRQIYASDGFKELAFMDDWQTGLAEYSKKLDDSHKLAEDRAYKLNSKAEALLQARELLEMGCYSAALNILTSYEGEDANNELKLLLLWARTGVAKTEEATSKLEAAKQKVGQVDQSTENVLGDAGGDLDNVFSSLDGSDENPPQVGGYSEVFQHAVEQVDNVLAFDQRPWVEFAKVNDFALDAEGTKLFQLSIELKQRAEYLKDRAASLLSGWQAVKSQAVSSNDAALITSLQAFIANLRAGPTIELAGGISPDWFTELSSLSVTTAEKILSLVKEKQKKFAEINQKSRPDLLVFAKTDNIKKSPQLLERIANRWWSLYKQESPAVTMDNWPNLNTDLDEAHAVFAETMTADRELHLLHSFLVAACNNQGKWKPCNRAPQCYAEYKNGSDIKPIWPELYQQFECARAKAVVAVCQDWDNEIAEICGQFIAQKLPSDKTPKLPTGQNVSGEESPERRISQESKKLQDFFNSAKPLSERDSQPGQFNDYFKFSKGADVGGAFGLYQSDAVRYFNNPQPQTGKRDDSGRLDLYLWIGALKNAAQMRSRLRLDEPPLPGWIFFPWRWGGAQTTWENLHQLAAASEKTSYFGKDLWHKLAEEAKRKVDELQSARFPKSWEQLWIFLCSPQFLHSLGALTVFICIFLVFAAFFLGIVMAGNIRGLQGFRGDLHTAVPSSFAPMVYRLVGGTLGPSVTPTPTLTATFTHLPPTQVTPLVSPVPSLTGTPTLTSTPTLGCDQDPSGYSFTLAGEPLLQPSQGTDINKMNELIASITWTLENSGRCPWPIKNLALKQLVVTPVRPFLLEMVKKSDTNPDDQIAPGEQLEIKLSLNRWETDAAFGQWLFVLEQSDKRYRIIVPSPNAPALVWIAQPGLNLSLDSCWVCK